MAKSNNKSESFEKTLFKAADKLRKNMDAAEYKHIVLGLIFLKFISDSFEEMYKKLSEGQGEYAGADPEDADEYRAENVFFVPQSARWSYLYTRAKLPTIGTDIDSSMEAIEKENPTLKGILPKVYARPNLDKAALGGLLDLIGNIALGDEASKAKDLLGKVYEYFLGEFALAEGKKGGQFYTPRSVVQLLVEMLEPYKGRVFDPCCGSGGMFVMSEKFVQSHQGRIDDISIYGQESNQTTYRLCRMNLAIRGIDGSQVKWNNEGSFLNDSHKDLKADFVIANPPFNDSDWSGELLQNDARWKYGTPPAGNANYAWMQHFLYHLSPNGRAGFVLANSSLSAERTGEIPIRKELIDNDLVECILILPKNLFYNTSIPACLWFLSRNKKEAPNKRNVQRNVLFIDARNFGRMVDKSHRVIDSNDISKLTDIYKQWKSVDGNYKDIPQLCKSVTIEQIAANKYSLSPNLYIDYLNDNQKTLDNTRDGMTKFVQTISSKDNERNILNTTIKSAFQKIGYDNMASINFSNISYKGLIQLQKLLFDRWFLHFDIPVTKFKPINFVETTHRDIPSIPTNWRLEEISKVCDVVDCLHSKKPERLELSEYVLLEVNNISSDGLIDLTDKYFISKEDHLRWTRNIEVCEGDCVITNTGRVGAVAQIPKNLCLPIGRNMTAVRALQGKMLPTYLIGYLMSEYMRIETYRKTDIGTILDSLNVKGIKKLLILVPPYELIELYESFARPIRRLIEIGASSTEQ